MSHLGMTYKEYSKNKLDEYLRKGEKIHIKSAHSMDSGIEHTKDSIISEHYGFTPGLLEDVEKVETMPSTNITFPEDECVCYWQKVCLCGDCHCNFCYSEKRSKEVNGKRV